MGGLCCCRTRLGLVVLAEMVAMRKPMITRAEVDDFLARDPATMDTRARLVRQLFDLYRPDEPDKAAPRGGRPSETQAFDYTDASWRELAACRDADPDLFFPTVGVSARIVAKAKTICAGCPVIEECLDYALTTPGTQYGIWGGLTERERRQVKRRRRVAS